MTVHVIAKIDSMDELHTDPRRVAGGTCASEDGAAVAGRAPAGGRRRGRAAGRPIVDDGPDAPA